MSREMSPLPSAKTASIWAMRNENKRGDPIDANPTKRESIPPMMSQVLLLGSVLSGKISDELFVMVFL